MFYIHTFASSTWRIIAPLGTQICIIMWTYVYLGMWKAIFFYFRHLMKCHMFLSVRIWYEIVTAAYTSYISTCMIIGMRETLLLVIIILQQAIPCAFGHKDKWLKCFCGAHFRCPQGGLCLHVKGNKLDSSLIGHNLEVETLYICGENITSVPQDLLFGLPNLKEFILRCTHISSIPFGIFHNMTHLREIYLDCNENAYLPPNIFSTLENLIVLNLGYNTIRILHPNVTVGLQNMWVRWPFENEDRKCSIHQAKMDLNNMKREH